MSVVSLPVRRPDQSANFAWGWDDAKDWCKSYLARGRLTIGYPP